MVLNVLVNWRVIVWGLALVFFAGIYSACTRRTAVRRGKWHLSHLRAFQCSKVCKIWFKGTMVHPAQHGQAEILEGRNSLQTEQDFSGAGSPSLIR